MMSEYELSLRHPCIMSDSPALPLQLQDETKIKNLQRLLVIVILIAAAYIGVNP